MSSPNQYPLENAPKIEGLVYRHFEGDPDYPKILAIFTNLHAIGQYPGHSSIESLRAEYTNLIHTDLHDDIIFAEVNGETVAFAKFTWNRETASNAYAYNIDTLRVDPAWQGRGIEQSLIRWGEARAKHYAAVLPEGEHGFMVVNCRQTDQLRLEILESMGYSISRYYHTMSRPLNDLPQSPLPEGITVRPVLPKHIKQIWDAGTEAFMDEYGATDEPEDSFHHYSSNPEFQPLLWQVAWDGDEVVGSVMNFISMPENELEDRRRGYTEGISVRKKWRGRGIARALICRSMAMFKALNMDEVALTADTENPTGAMGLYLGLGYQPYRTVLELKKNMNSCEPKV